MLLLMQMLLLTGVTGIRILPKSLFGSLVNVPLNGPCVLNNENAFKCTATGYYETVQCDDSGCFCVDARNGAAAEGTRTNDNKKAPTCSQCHNYLKTQFANGEPPQNSFIPHCDRDMGDFEKLQCTGEYCFCVDPKSGKEVPGTKKKREGNFILHCDDKGLVSTSAKAREDGQVLPVGREYCKMDRDRGHSCDVKSRSTMFYFDSTTFDCLAFEYQGCGGNDNRFYSKLDCEATCLLSDFVACSGLATPAKTHLGGTIACGGALPDAPRSIAGIESSCPKDYTCVMGPFSGFCCPKDTEDKYARAYKPKCPHGIAAQVRRRDGKYDFLLGKRCEDSFCPNTHRCIQDDPFAYCCPPNVY